MRINAGDAKIILSDGSVDYLESEFRRGIESAAEYGWISEEKIRSKYK